MRRVIAGDRGWCDECGRDEDARPERPNGTEQELADAEGQPGGNGANDNRAEPAGAKTASVNSSQQSAPIAAMLRRMPMKIMMVVSVR
jgi:hypothetical protein